MTTKKAVRQSLQLKKRVYERFDLITLGLNTIKFNLAILT